MAAAALRQAATTRGGDGSCESVDGCVVNVAGRIVQAFCQDFYL